MLLHPTVNTVTMEEFERGAEIFDAGIYYTPVIIIFLLYFFLYKSYFND